MPAAPFSDRFQCSPVDVRAPFRGFSDFAVINFCLINLCLPARGLPTARRLERSFHGGFAVKRGVNKSEWLITAPAPAEIRKM